MRWDRKKRNLSVASKSPEFTFSWISEMLILELTGQTREGEFMLILLEVQAWKSSKIFLKMLLFAKWKRNGWKKHFWAVLHIYWVSSFKANFRQSNEFSDKSNRLFAIPSFSFLQHGQFREFFDSDIYMEETSDMLRTRFVSNVHFKCYGDTGNKLTFNGPLQYPWLFRYVLYLNLFIFSVIFTLQ